MYNYSSLFEMQKALFLMFNLCSLYKHGIKYILWQMIHKSKIFFLSCFLFLKVTNKFLNFSKLKFPFILF